MSKQYPGGIISKTAPVPSGPYQNSTAPGVWTLEQQAAYAKLGQWPTAGNVNPNAFIENLFSTYLYTGTGAAQTITNGINLSANGGLVWIKNRSVNYNHLLSDTTRGAGKVIFSDSLSAQQTDANDITAFNTTGFSIGNNGRISNPPNLFVSWTFREQPKFFDIVTYTGNDAGTREIAHNLGSAPGCMIVKSLNNALDWFVWHRSSPGAGYTLNLNTIAAAYNSSNWGAGRNTPPTSTVFTVGDNANVSGYTYVAYLFAHDAGGFGLTGTDNVISCGSFTTDGSANATVTLGYEPQWVMIKSSSNTGNWFVIDNMRNFSQTVTASLSPNLNNVEAAGFGDATYSFFPTATGFQSVQDLAASQTYIYVAIRRGPMAVPTSGTSVFSPVTRAGNDVNPTVVTTPNFAVDMQISTDRGKVASAWNWAVDKLRGTSVYLPTNNTDSEYSDTDAVIAFTNTGFNLGASGKVNASGGNYIYWNFKRAPSFFDEVCYTGTGSATTQTHNLGVVPELMIIKRRTTSDGAGFWAVYSAPTGNTKFLTLNATSAENTNSTFWNNTTPTSSVFTVGTITRVNGSGETYVAYLFATCAGVSKVGSYTGTGAAQTINCGFTGGSRFVLIKRTDSTGDWYVWDSARGIIPSNDPYLLLNSTAAEVTGTDYIDTTSVGFDVTSTAPAAINANGGTFIFLAIA